MKFNRNNISLSLKPLMKNLYKKEFLKQAASNILLQAYYSEHSKITSIPFPIQQVTLDTINNKLFILIALVKQYNCKRIFEIGTYKGSATYALAEYAHVFTLDIAPKVEIDHPGITQLKADSTTFDYSAYRDMDMVFVDGGHDYDTVKADTNSALSIVKKGGIIVWHDYLNFDGVTKYLNELSLPLKRFRNTSLVIYENA